MRDEGQEIDSFADRIEEAYNRKRERGEEAAQICGEVCEMIGMEAACKEKVADCNHLGNAAKMREALESVRNWFINRLCNSSYQVTIEGLLLIVNAALSAPPRNCDVLSKDEVLEMLKDRSFSKEDTIEWLYGKAEGGVVNGSK